MIDLRNIERWKFNVDQIIPTCKKLKGFSDNIGKKEVTLAMKTVTLAWGGLLELFTDLIISMHAYVYKFAMVV